MEAVCIETYYDEQLHRTIGKGEKLVLSKERFEELSTKKNKSKRILVESKKETTVKEEEKE